MKKTSGTHVQDESILELVDMAVRYGSIQVLKGINLSVNPGEIVALLGPNGAGKTSLMYGISGILPLAKGRVTFDGKVINGLSPDRIARLGMRFVPEGRMLFVHLTVLSNLELGAYHRRSHEKKDIEEDMEGVFRLFPRLKERTGQLAGQLSGGEQQMLAVGRALMSRPRLLLLDEPSLGLAPVLVNELMETLAKLVDEGMTILIAEQNAHAALKVASRGYILGTSGEVVMAGSQKELQSSSAIKAAYLGAH